MKELHTNFKIIKCGIFINEEYPWLRSTPDFLCCCDWGEGCGEVKYPFCIEVTSIILWRRALRVWKKIVLEFQSKNPTPVLLPFTTADFYIKETVLRFLLFVLLMMWKRQSWLCRELVQTLSTGRLSYQKWLTFGKHVCYQKCLVGGIVGSTVPPKLTIHQSMMYGFAELQQRETLPSTATRNVPLEIFTFPAYKLSVCLRHGIVQTVELCQNSGEKENLLSLLKTSTPSPALAMDAIAYVKASLMKVTGLWNVTVLNASRANIFICHVSA